MKKQNLFLNVLSNLVDNNERSNDNILSFYMKIENYENTKENKITNNILGVSDIQLDGAEDYYTEMYIYNDLISDIIVFDTRYSNRNNIRLEGNKIIIEQELEDFKYDYDLDVEGEEYKYNTIIQIELKSIKDYNLKSYEDYLKIVSNLYDRL